jgi:hypothetical protein
MIRIPEVNRELLLVVCILLGWYTVLDVIVVVVLDLLSIMRSENLAAPKHLAEQSVQVIEQLSAKLVIE